MTKEYWANFILCGFLVVLAIFAITRMPAVLTPKGLFMDEPRPSEEAAHLVDDIRLTRFGIVREGDHRIVADFYVRNNSSSDVKNLHIVCEFYDRDGNYLDREKWILYRTFPAGREVKHSTAGKRFINTGERKECLVADLEPVSEPFFSLHGSEGNGHGASSHGDHGSGKAHGGGH
jgi:hypothetical protein